MTEAENKIYKKRSTRNLMELVASGEAAYAKIMNCVQAPDAFNERVLAAQSSFFSNPSPELYDAWRQLDASRASVASIFNYCHSTARDESNSIVRAGVNTIAALIEDADSEFAAQLESVKASDLQLSERHGEPVSSVMVLRSLMRKREWLAEAMGHLKSGRIEDARSSLRTALGFQGI